MKTYPGVMIAGAVCALAVAGCSPDGRATGRLTAASRTTEGARVTGAETATVSVEGGGQVTSAAPVTTPFAATLTDGVAQVARGPLVAVTGARGSLRRHFEVVDSATQEVLSTDIDRAEMDGPITHVHAVLGRRLVVDDSLTWRRDGDVWVMVAEHGSVAVPGRRTVRVDRNVQTGAVQLGLGSRARFDLALVLHLLAPTPAQALPACWSQCLAYIKASALLGVGTDVLILQPETIALGSTVAWTLAYENWVKALQAYASCMDAHSA